MKIRKNLSIILLSSALFGIGFYSINETNLPAKAVTTAQNTDQGKIIVHYVDQNGNEIRPDTVATGAPGTTYVAKIPQIKGYTYSKIENGQNDAYGPQMTFGGGDSVTSVMSMTIVYQATSSSDKGKNPTTNNNEPETSASANANQKNPSSESKNTTPNQSNANQKKLTNNKPKDNEKQSKNIKNKKQKTPAKNNHQVAWLVGGIILLILIIGSIWKFMKKPLSDKH